MPDLAIGMADLAEELEQIPVRDHSSVKEAIRETLSVDAFRWIDWAIRGGGWDGGQYYQPVDTGDYARSWFYEETDDGGVFYSSPNPPIKAGVIEEGRRPAWIPIEPLAHWVRRKLGVTDPKAARSIAFLISRKASKTRRPGLFVLRRAHQQISDALFHRVEAIMARGRR